MADGHIRIWSQGGYQDLDAATVTSTDATADQNRLVRQRVDIPNPVTITGTISANATPNVTVTNWTVPFPVTVTGNLSATVNQATVTQGTTPWIVAGTVTATGVTVSISTVTVTQGTSPWIVSPSSAIPVTGFPATQAVTFTNPAVTLLTSPVAVTQSFGTLQVAVTGTPLSVTFSAGTVPVSQATIPWTVTFTNPTVAVSGTTTVTFSSGTQPISGTVTANQGTSPWVVSGTSTLLGLGPSFPAVTITGTITANASPNVTVTNWTYANPITVTGNLSVTPTPNVTVTNWTYANPITVTGFPATQPVTFTNPAVTILGTPIAVTFTSGTQPVSGTVTANQGGAPWSVTQSASPWGVSGTLAATLTSLTATPTAFLAVTFTNPAVTVLGTPTVTFSSGTRPVSQATTPWTVTFTNPTVAISGTPTVTFSSGTQPISGTVTANQGTNPWVVSGTDTLLGLGPSFPTVTVTGNLSVTPTPNVTITNWTYANPITVTGNLSVTPTPNVTITNWTYANPITVTGFPATQTVTFTQPNPALVPVIIDCASSGLNLLVTGSAGVASYVLSYALVASAPVTLQFYDNASTPVSLTGRVSVTTTGGVALAGGTIASPLFFTATSRGIQVSLSGAVQVGGHLMVAQQ